MSEVQIEKGIPVPVRKTKASKYPWAELEVGDSFFIEEDEAPGTQSLKSAAEKAGIKITVRAVEDGLRVWRTE